MAKLESEIVRWGKLLFERRLISGWGGNLSCRANKTDFLITAQHAPLGFLTPRDVVRLKSDGKPARRERRPSSETPMHLAVYAGTDAQAIVHAHPPLVLAFSLSHDSFAPVSYEEQYTIGRVSVIAQDTPTVTKPEALVEALRYAPIVIVRGHGTVAIGQSLQEAFLYTDLLEEAVHCQLFQSNAASAETGPTDTRSKRPVTPTLQADGFALFSREHMRALVDMANQDSVFRTHGADTGLTTSLTLQLEGTNSAWTVRYANGEITDLLPGRGGEFVISGKAEWWDAVFRGRIDPFLATQQGKLKLESGELAQLSRWYKPFQRAFALWQTVPIQ
jgi:L-fuculose-phosphate aldolase